MMRGAFGAEGVDVFGGAAARPWSPDNAHGHDSLGSDDSVPIGGPPEGPPIIAMQGPPIIAMPSGPVVDDVTAAPNQTLTRDSVAAAVANANTSVERMAAAARDGVVVPKRKAKGKAKGKAKAATVGAEDVPPESESSEYSDDSEGSEGGGASPAPKGKAKHAVQKKPAACMPPAKKAKVVKRPPLPKLKMGTTVYYLTGKVNVSLAKECFRVFADTANVVDQQVRWNAHTTHQEAWDDALSRIEAFAAKKKK